jgi:glyoxylase-like metal-dependent hydrolase (beta-lactamase superfamily II)
MDAQMFDFQDYGEGIHAYDSGYVRPKLAAIHLVVERGRAALIDAGTNDSLQHTLEALDRVGLGPDSVDYVILTHIHLDHAGGAGRLMATFPSARLVVHPRGARHMADPRRLVAGVTAVYGEDYVREMYGELLPVPSGRIVEAGDGHVIDLAGRLLNCLDTPGHARHHLCIADSKTGGIFSGDMFGISYRENDVDGRPFIFPTTTPSQFDPGAMHASVDRLVASAPEAIYLTHYGRVGDVARLGADLHRRLDAIIALAEATKGPAEVRHRNLVAALTEYLLAELRRHGCRLADDRILDIWQSDLELDAQGLEVWLDAREGLASA